MGFPETGATTHRAISGFSLHMPLDRIVKSAGSKTCPLVNSSAFMLGKVTLMFIPEFPLWKMCHT
jgi:hypothetical protein